MLTLVGLALRAARLDFQPLWWDEGYSVWFATHPLGQMAALTAEDIHPPLYYALLHGWIRLYGTAPAALRLLSVVCGTLTIPALYLAGRQLTGSRRMALLATALLAVNPLHIFYSQEIRMYGLVALLSVGVLAAAWRLFDTEPRRPEDTERFAVSLRLRVPVSPHHLVTYILLTTLALYTQYYAIFLPAGLSLYAAWRWRRDLRALARWLAAQALVALFYLPWALYAAPRLVPYISQKIVADADKPLGVITYVARHLAAFLVGHLEGPLAPWWPLALALLLPLAIGWWLIVTRRTANSERQTVNGGWQMANGRRTSHIPHPASGFLATVLLTALALGWLISLRAPFFPPRGERLLILALPASVLLAAAGVDALWQRWRAIAYVTFGGLLAASSVSLIAFYTVPRYADDDYRPLIAQAVQQGLPEDSVYCVYPWQVGYWRVYGTPNGPTALLTPATEWGPTVAAMLDSSLARGRVWFPAHLALGTILESQVEAYLAGRGVPFVNQWYGPNTRLSAWMDSATNFTNFIKADMGVRFALSGGGTLSLQAVSGSSAPVPAANTVTPVVLAWEANAPPPVLAVSVRLTDDLGQLWAQHDYEPQSTIADPRSAIYRATDRLGLLVPAGTPPGRYHVELVLRPKGDTRPLDAFGPDGASLGTAVRLYDLEVIPPDRPLGPERLPIAVRREIAMRDGLRFLGYSTDPGPIVPGELRRVNLFWQALAQPKSDYNAFVQVLGHDGAPVALWEAPAGAAYPTSAWRPGTLMRTQAALRVPPSVPDGRYRLIAGLFQADDKIRLPTAAGAEHLALGEVAVRGRPHRMTPPQAAHPADFAFGSVARLVGYDLTVPADGMAPGASFQLVLHWQALSAADRPYAVFVHLLDEAGAVRGYGDAEPGNGAFPTPGWLTGEYLADVHRVQIGADAPSGVYRLAIGFYDPATGERLKTPEGADQVLLAETVTVR
ncbi:MAG: glycosyltransferase family 39 protein [Anaerolineae bacterium]